MFSSFPAPLSRLALPLLGAVVALVVYWPVIHLGFVWDDRPLYVDLPSLRDTSSFWAGTFNTVQADLHYFRPLALLTFKLQFLWLGDAPIWGHSISLGLHVLNTFLVTWLAAAVVPGDNAQTRNSRALFAGLFYALHPALIEPVSWMSCRFDLLVTTFLLLALCADVHIRSGLARALVVASLFFMAANSKEMAAPFPAVLALFQLATRYRDVSWREVPKRFVSERDWLTYLFLLLAGLGYLGARWSFMGSSVDTDADIVAELASVEHRLAFIASTITFFVRMIVTPFDSINPLHPVHLETLAFTYRDALTLGLVAALLGMLAVGISRKVACAILLAGAFVALVPALNIIPVSIARNIGHERYLTFPMGFVALAVAVIPLPDRRSASFRGAVVASAAFALAWLGMAVANIRITVPLWASDISLWNWAYHKNPDSDYAHYSLVTALLQARRPDAAGHLLGGSVPATAYRGITELTYGEYLVNAGDAEAGVRHIEKALRAFPPWHLEPPQDDRSRRDFATYRGHVGIGYCYLAEVALRLGNYLDARDYAAVAEHYYPRFGRALAVYSMSMYGLNQPNEAELVFELATARAAPEKQPAMLAQRDIFLRDLCAGSAAKPARTCAQVGSDAHATGSD